MVESTRNFSLSSRTEADVHSGTPPVSLGTTGTAGTTGTPSVPSTPTGIPSVLSGTGTERSRYGEEPVGTEGNRSVPTGTPSGSVPHAGSGVVSVSDRLQAPFASQEVKHRVGRVFADGRAGILFLYVDARSCQDRLDAVLGSHGWSTAFDFHPVAAGGIVVCTLTAHIDGVAVQRADCAEAGALADVKSAASTAFKRACAALGVGRYLYAIGEVRVRLDNRTFRGSVLLPDRFLPTTEQSGRTRLEIVYDDGADAHSAAAVATTSNASTGNARAAATEHPPELADALEFVSRTTGYSEGRKLKDLSVKTLGWLFYNAVDDNEKKAASIVRKYLLAREQSSNDRQNVDRMSPPHTDPAPHTDDDEIDIPF